VFGNFLLFTFPLDFHFFFFIIFPTRIAELEKFKIEKNHVGLGGVGVKGVAKFSTD
jgi:hypothetical protein